MTERRKMTGWRRKKCKRRLIKEKQENAGRPKDNTLDHERMKCRKEKTDKRCEVEPFMEFSMEVEDT